MNPIQPCICQLPDDCWIDLTMIRKLEAQIEESKVIFVNLEWANGEQKTLMGNMATALLTAWKKYSEDFAA
jgi:hypothetical protein